MVLRYGMDEKLGHVAYERERQPHLGTPPQGWFAREYSDETDRLIDHAVRELIGDAFDHAVAIVDAHRQLHEKTAQLLLQKETLDGEDLEALRAQVSPVSQSEAAAREPPPAAARVSIALK
jgi:cell division protease FtsH